MITPLYKYGAIAVVCLALMVYVAATAHRYGAQGVQAKWDRETQAVATQVATQRAQTAETIIDEVAANAEKKLAVEIHIPAIRAGLERLCPAGSGTAGVQRPTAPAEGSTENADAGRIDELAADLRAARLNQLDCQTLINIVRPQATRTRGDAP